MYTFKEKKKTFTLFSLKMKFKRLWFEIQNNISKTDWVRLIIKKEFV